MPPVTPRVFARLVHAVGRPLYHRFARDPEDPVITRRSRSSVIERGERAAPADEDDGLSFPRTDVATHAGRVGGHARKGQPDRIRTNFEEALDRTDGNVPLDDVALDDGCVAGAGAVRNPSIGAKRRSIGVVGHLDLGAVLLQVHDPPRAAASTGIASNLESNARQFRSENLRGWCRRDT
ncbi:MAG: hypothetical protein ACI9OJ_004133 [Myxococcota bacterium]